MKSNIQASLLHERGQTDTSLVSERGKTDDSFAEHRKQTELQTDLRVKTDRDGADVERARSRKKTDAKTSLGRSNGTTANKVRTPEEVFADTSLTAQRERDDAMVTSERSLMDAALVYERGLNDSESNRFLERERKETDKNLLRERTHTDSEALTSSKLLLSELTSHQLTKAALTSRDEFLAIVSHDLRNPIGAILSYADLILEDCPETVEEAGKWAAVIKRNAVTALRLIGDILDMERFAEGKLQMQFSPRDIHALIDETVESFKIAAEEKSITLHAQQEKIEHLVSCDRERIGQVLANLVGNALKFTPKGGSITITGMQVGNEMRVSVNDSGPGIAEDQKMRIFERYAQIGNKDRRGLGLGLYISAMLIEAHNGTIGVASCLGQGSTFRFSIPINRSQMPNLVFA